MTSRWVWTPEDGAPDRAWAGGKGFGLARLTALAATIGFRVPRFVIVRTEAFERFMESGGAESEPKLEARAPHDTGVPPAQLREIPAQLRDEVLAALTASGLAGCALAVRSSAVAEDGAAASFAGQFDSVLGVPGAEDPALWNALLRVWASAHHAHAIAYSARGAPSAMRMAVVLQELVTPVVSGVVFSADPVSGERDVAVVSAVFGLGEGLVSGELDADAYRVDRDGNVSATLAHKDRTAVALPRGGTTFVSVDEHARDRAALTDDEARRIAACARAIADAEGAPQDIEWALVGDGGTRELVILQTRPITTLGDPASATGDASRPGASVVAHGAVTATTVAGAVDRAPATRRVWDNSNIVESYSGVTTPLTFSFARGVYEDVYQQFCRVMGVSEPMIAAHAHVFANLLGLVRGRVYYNLLHWYRTLALLPGFTFNRAFMERMMGVREALEDPPPPPTAGSRLRDLAALARMLAALVREHGKLAREVPRFHARVEAALGPMAAVDLTTWSEADLAAGYARLERDLLRHWRPPLVNDFFAMIFFGVLGRLIERWLKGAPPTLANDLLCGEGGIISTEPARHVMNLARMSQNTPAVAVALKSGDARAVRDRLAADPACTAFRHDVDAYLARFGDRCLEELKLETVTLREDPSFLFDMIRSYAERGTVDPAVQAERETSIRRAAESVVRDRLRGMKRAVLFWVLRRARARIRDRENLRFERTRVFGVVRRLFLGLGARFTERGAIAQPRDVFWLTVEEVLEAAGRAPAGSSAAAGGATVAGVPAGVFGWVSEPVSTAALAARARERRARFEVWIRGPAPPDRFETHAVPEIVFGAESADPAADVAFAPATGAELRGTGCCPGTVRERVRIVRDPREATGVSGRILVAERTDPGWTLLFPAVRGLLVQRGSLLSHSAIVAREMGIPCVVGIAGLLDTLTDGEWVEMDGTTGIVRRLGAGPQEVAASDGTATTAGTAEDAP